MSKVGTIEIIDGKIKPRRAHNKDAGLDIAIQEDLIIQPNETIYAPAGVKLDLNDGYRADVMTRSSTACKYGLTIVPTVVDQFYKGEISTILSNYTHEPIEIKKGTYLAQVIISKTYEFDNEVEAGVECSEKARNPLDRFGSSDQCKYMTNDENDPESNEIQDIDELALKAMNNVADQLNKRSNELGYDDVISSIRLASDRQKKKFGIDLEYDRYRLTLPGDTMTVALIIDEIKPNDKNLYFEVITKDQKVGKVLSTIAEEILYVNKESGISFLFKTDDLIKAILFDGAKEIKLEDGSTVVELNKNVMFGSFIANN